MYGNHQSAHVITTRTMVIVFADVDSSGVSPRAVTLTRLLTAAGIDYTSTVVSARCAACRIESGYYGDRALTDELIAAWLTATEPLVAA